MDIPAASTPQALQQRHPDRQVVAGPQLRVRRHAHAGIGGAEAAIALAFTPALDDLEAEALMEGVGVGVAEGAVGFGVVKQVQRCVSRLFASPDMPLLRAATLFSF